MFSSDEQNNYVVRPCHLKNIPILRTLLFVCFLQHESDSSALTVVSVVSHVYNGTQSDPTLSLLITNVEVFNRLH